MTVNILPASQTQFTIEAGNWLVMRRPQPEMAELSAEELLQRTQQDLVVPLRYGKNPPGKSPQSAFLIGECPVHARDEHSWESNSADQEETHELAQRTLQHWLTGESEPGVPPDIEAVETALSEVAREWTRRDDCWIVPAGSQSPVELRVVLVPRGLRVEGVLGSGEAYDPLARRALAEFLCRVQWALRFARMELDEHVRVVAEVDTRSIHCNFDHGLRSVAEACRVLAAEVRALSTPELARAYLSDVCDAPVRKTDAARSG